MVLGGFFTEPGHGNPRHPAFRHPAIHVAIGNDQDWKTNQIDVPKVASAGLVGMLDTSADLCRIDVALANEFDLEDTGRMPSILPGHKVDIPMASGQIIILDFPFTLDGSFPVADLRASGYQYDLLLGMDLLRFFQFRIDSLSEVVELEFVRPE